MTAIELLKVEDLNRRTYRSNSVYIDAVGKAIKRFQQRFPDQDWQRCCRLISGVPGKGDYEVSVNHLIKWGDADASVMEKHWGVVLPNWVHHFYSHISEAVFNWRNLIRVMPLDEVIQTEDEQRGYDGGADLPVRLIRFATVWLTGCHLAFRQTVRDDNWRIMYVSDDEPTEYFQNSSLDGSEDDEDINAWVRRMTETDGFPVASGNEKFERLFVHRVD